MRLRMNINMLRKTHRIDFYKEQKVDGVVLSVCLKGPQHIFFSYLQNAFCIVCIMLVWKKIFIKGKLEAEVVSQVVSFPLFSSS